MIRWPTPTAGQNLQVSQAGCHYGVSRDSLTFTAAGGTSTFDVVQQSEPYTCGGPLQNACVWTAVADSAWITVTGSMPRVGDDRVTVVVAPNSTGTAPYGHDQRSQRDRPRHPGRMNDTADDRQPLSRHPARGQTLK